MRPGLAVPALVIAALIGGCGSSDTPSASTAPPAVPSTTTPRTQTQPAPGPRRSPRARKPSRRTTPTPKTRTTPSQAASHAKRAPGTWSGTGTTHLGTIIVKRQSILTLSATGNRSITLSDASHAIDVSGAGKGGQTVVPPGTYRSVTVTARGKWTIRIKTLRR